MSDSEEVRTPVSMLDSLHPSKHSDPFAVLDHLRRGYWRVGDAEAPDGSRAKATARVVEAIDFAIRAITERNAHAQALVSIHRVLGASPDEDALVAAQRRMSERDAMMTEIRRTPDNVVPLRVVPPAPANTITLALTPVLEAFLKAATLGTAEQIAVASEQTKLCGQHGFPPGHVPHVHGGEYKAPSPPTETQVAQEAFELGLRMLLQNAAMTPRPVPLSLCGPMYLPR